MEDENTSLPSGKLLVALNSLMKSHTDLLYPSQDVNHPFLQYIPAVGATCPFSLKSYRSSRSPVTNGKTCVQVPGNIITPVIHIITHVIICMVSHHHKNKGEYNNLKYFETHTNLHDLYYSIWL